MTPLLLTASHKHAQQTLHSDRLTDRPYRDVRHTNKKHDSLNAHPLKHIHTQIYIFRNLCMES